MKTQVLETMTRRAVEGVSRRASLAATVATPDVSQAKKKSGKTCKKKETKRCNNDAAQCRVLVPLGCNNIPECIAELSLCCDTCSANDFLTCLAAASASATAMFA